MALKYSTVRVNVTSIVADGIDEDDTPDDKPLTGTMVLTPMVDATAAIQYDDGGTLKLKTVSVIRADISLSGDVSHQGRDYVKVLAPTAATTNLTQLQWQASFVNLRYGTQAVSIKPIYFYAEPDAEINLAEHVNVAPSSLAVQLSRGPRGFGIGEVTTDAETAEVVFKLDDNSGTEVGRVAIPEAEVSDASVADLVASAAETTAAVDARVRAVGDGTYATPTTVASAVTPKLDKTEAAATYATTESIGPAVTAAIAADGTVADAAVAAVGTEVAARKLVSQNDPGIPSNAPLSEKYAEVKLGINDELVIGYKTNGAVEIPIAEIAGGRTQAVNAEDLSWVPFVDSDGRIPEIHTDKAGRVQQWALDRWKTRMGLTGADPATTSWPSDIWIFAGQSNATQRSTLTAVIEPDTDSVVMWNGSTFVTATGVPWLGSGFAREYAEKRGRPRRRRVAVVSAALGSTGFSSLSPGTWDRTVTTGADAYLYPEMIAKAQAALAAAPAGSVIKGVVWSQGEQDRPIAATTYQAKLDDLIAQTRIDLGIPDLPFVIGSVSPDWLAYLASTSDARGAAIDAILEDTPRRVLRTSYTKGPASMSEVSGDGIHWSPLGQTVRGKKMAGHGLDSALLNTVDALPLPPVNLRVSRSGGTATIEWDHPATRVTSYAISTSIDSGATWITQTLAAATTHKHVMSVAAGTPLWVRGTATNEIGTSLASGEVHS